MAVGSRESRDSVGTRESGVGIQDSGLGSHWGVNGDSHWGLIGIGESLGTEGGPTLPNFQAIHANPRAASHKLASRAQRTSKPGVVGPAIELQ